MDEELRESVCKMQLEKSSLMKDALSLHQSDIVPRKEKASYRKLHSMVADILEGQEQS